ncbi:MAG: hypothetical protein J7623_28455 [Chitinophaga sp.]|uniref:hypothetical protein n=1 Tax=Chitinophaga sp. TaxID=1869181 RepID=UPI001B2D1316|nr:hypothetical protein [Chitinophaga sp.]MBO9732608.1 hypothetical protein [Chitinophaga sp.]
MRKNLRRLASFAIFDLPLNAGYIQLLLRNIQKQELRVVYNWNIEGTRRKLIAYYWYKHVLCHFLILFGIGLLIISPFSPYFNLLYLSVLFVIGAISFGVVYLFIYLPLFSVSFLPQLETLIANHKSKQVEKPQTKSVKTQSKIPALTVTLYILLKTAGVERIASDAFSAQMLNRLTGVDTDSIKENLRRIIHPKNLTPKERAEVVKGITVARTYFEKLGHPPAIGLLDELEKKLEKE